MERKMIIRFDQRNWALIVLLMICCSKWLFEDILGMTLLEPVLLSVGFVILLLQRKCKIKKTSLIWIFYIISLCMNLFYHGASAGVLGRAGIVVFTVSYILFLDEDDFSVENIVNLIYYIGLFHAFMVLIHFVLKGTFNAFYFPFLQSITREYAVLYYRGGRYFGILTSPHEVAGLISFALLILFIRILLNKELNMKNAILLFLLGITLFLTGKKGVMGVLFISIVILFFVLYCSRKNFHKLLGAIVLLVIGVSVLFYLVKSFPDNPLFYRINQFIYRLSNDIDASSGRTALQQIAYNLWEENRWMGIGWRRFKSLTTTDFGYDLGHQVNLDYLQWLCEMGIVGFILNVIPIVFMLKRTMYICGRIVKRLPNNNYKCNICFAVTLQFFTVIYAFIEVPFYDIMFFAMYAVSCIIINSVYCKRNKMEMRLK